MPTGNSISHRTSAASTPPGPSFQSSHTQINLGSRQVLVSGRDVHLRPKEFDVLHYLITNPNVVVPHGKLIQAIWGPDYGDEVEYLQVIVNQVRKKIEPNQTGPATSLPSLASVIASSSRPVKAEDFRKTLGHFKDIVRHAPLVFLMETIYERDAFRSSGPLVHEQ
jgi:hypothetical protein